MTTSLSTAAMSPQAIERLVTRFHWLRLIVWTVQIPVAVATPLKSSVVYLVFLSLAALVESAGTDVYTAWRAKHDDDA